MLVVFNLVKPLPTGCPAIACAIEAKAVDLTGALRHVERCLVIGAIAVVKQARAEVDPKHGAVWCQSQPCCAPTFLSWVAIGLKLVAIVSVSAQLGG